MPTPGSKTMLAGDSRRRQALMTLLDALGLTTDEVPLAVGVYFGAFRASALRQVLQAAKTIERAVRMGDKSVSVKTDAMDVSCQLLFEQPVPTTIFNNSVQSRSADFRGALPPIGRVRVSRGNLITLCRRVNNLDKEVQYAKLDASV